MMLLLETASGFALFEVLDEGQLDNFEDLHNIFSSAEGAQTMVRLSAFRPFANIDEALESIAKLGEGDPSKMLLDFLKDNCQDQTLAVTDQELGQTITEKLGVVCLHNNAVTELVRGVRCHLILFLNREDLERDTLSLSHSLNAYRLNQMVLLFETPLGFALFEVLYEGRKAIVEDMDHAFSSPQRARKMVKLKAFHTFGDMSQAVEAITNFAPVGSLRTFLENNCATGVLGVSDRNLGRIIREQLGITCIHNHLVMEFLRGIAIQLTALIPQGGFGDQDLAGPRAELSRLLNEQKLMRGPVKRDVMIIQTLPALDVVTNELNVYAMRVREWYGCHFPELDKLIPDSILYVRAVRAMGANRANAAIQDFVAEIGLSDAIEAELKEEAITSYGSEISDSDTLHINNLCDQVLMLHEDKTMMYDTVREHTLTIAPLLSEVVGDMIAARLIFHAGGLLKLAMLPASRLQLLGAEHAFFRALDRRRRYIAADTPKYGVLYRATKVIEARQHLKGRVARKLAARAARRARRDAFGVDPQARQFSSIPIGSS